MLPLAALLLACTLATSEPVHERAAHAGDDEIDPVRRLAGELARGERELAWEPRFGRLLALLEALEIPLDSQVLVFSKTSLQRDYISPRSPRAIYFSDEAYVGWIPGAPWIEVAGVSTSGGSFFVVAQDREENAAPRPREDCLQCHESGLTQGVPGFLVRSVHPAADGQPILRFGSFSTDHRSPYAERWGGWYVGGRFEGPHLGNRLADERGDALAFRSADAVTPERLDGVVDLSRYPRTTSDVVALLVLEHQVQAQNLFARSARETASALAMREVLNRLDERPAEAPREETQRRLAHQANTLLDYLLFVDEPPLGGEVRGDGPFAASFAARGPRDASGRSLSELHLRRRLLRWPLSYLVHSRAFGALPEELRAELWRQLGALLRENAELPARYEHLSPNARKALREHLLATHADAEMLRAGLELR
ncbi:MAG: hypothetical protein JNM84_24040 [Planctomycetes bacterium]|nr:hypothetical protein [Planctomycetota bacterium]